MATNAFTPRAAITARQKGGFSYGEGCDGCIDVLGRLHCGRDDDPSIPSAGMVESIVLDWYFSGDTRMRGPCSNPGGADRQIVARMFQAGSSDA